MEVKMKLDSRASVPTYAHDGDAGCDLAAAIPSPVVIYPGERKLISLGLSLEIPEGYELQIRPRSGLALNHGITVLNSPGTIDSGYRGEIGVVLYNSDRYRPFTVNQGDRIAQGVLAAVVRAKFVPADALEASLRAAGGYGSTGVGSVGYES